MTATKCPALDNALKGQSCRCKSCLACATMEALPHASPLNLLIQNRCRRLHPALGRCWGGSKPKGKGKKLTN